MRVGSGGITLVKSEELTGMPSGFVVMNKVTTGTSTVDTTTTPGYPNCVAVTSIWQSLVQEIDAEDVEEGLGVNVGGVVVGKTWVIITVLVISAVDIETEPGSVSVVTEVIGSNVIVVTTVEAGKVKVESSVDSEVVTGTWVVIVDVTGGNVIVDKMVLGGSCVVMIEALPGTCNVVVTICPGCVVVLIMVSGGATLVVVRVTSGSVEVDVTVDTIVLAGNSVVIT